VSQVTKGNKVKRALAALLVVGALAASVPATGFAGGGGSPTVNEPGGGGH
jgi:hypothetical protein